MGRFLSLLYGTLAYLFFLATFAYTLGFIANLGVPRSIDVGPHVPLTEAVVVNLVLLSIFAVQHSVMARRSFKQWLTRYVPWAVERSTFVLAASLALALLVWQWRPIPSPMLWHVTDPVGAKVLWALFWLGTGVLAVSLFLINHLELFGLEQVWSHFSGRKLRKPEFRTPLFYRYVRHPIYLGFVMMFWATPDMTAGRLLFAIGGTGYILVGIWFEERDLVAQFGERYRVYKRQVGMLLPRLRDIRDDEEKAG